MKKAKKFFNKVALIGQLDSVEMTRTQIKKNNMNAVLKPKTNESAKKQ